MPVPGRQDKSRSWQRPTPNAQRPTPNATMAPFSYYSRDSSRSQVMHDVGARWHVGAPIHDSFGDATLELVRNPNGGWGAALYHVECPVEADVPVAVRRHGDCLVGFWLTPLHGRDGGGGLGTAGAGGAGGGCCCDVTLTLTLTLPSLPSVAGAEGPHNGTKTVWKHLGVRPGERRLAVHHDGRGWRSDDSVVPLHGDGDGDGDTVWMRASKTVRVALVYAILNNEARKVFYTRPLRTRAWLD